MSDIFAAIVLVAITLTIFIVSYLIYRPYSVGQRTHVIENFEFPDAIVRKVRKTYPHLRKYDADQVINGLREYFHLCNLAGPQAVSMPSQAVDIAWHEFILFTREYEYFCNKAFGRFLHHRPAEAIVNQSIVYSGLSLAWRLSCFRENIVPRFPDRLPLLFALDRDLNIPDGFKYSVECSPSEDQHYCASDILALETAGRRNSGGCSGVVSTGCTGGCGSF